MDGNGNVFCSRSSFRKTIKKKHFIYSRYFINNHLHHHRYTCKIYDHGCLVDFSCLSRGLSSGADQASSKAQTIDHWDLI